MTNDRTIGSAMQLAEQIKSRAKDRMGNGWDVLSLHLQDAMICREIVLNFLGQNSKTEEILYLQALSRLALAEKK